MTTMNFKKPFLVLFVIALLLTGLLGKCCWNHAWLSIRVAFAEEQTGIFDEMRIKASQSDPDKAVEYLDYTLHYYPSGSKQVQGSRLDRIVERARDNAVSAIIADLRKRSDKDFGDDPQRWVDELKSQK